MIIKKIRLLLVSLMLLSAMPVGAISSKEKEQYIFGFIGATAICSGIYALVCYFTESDEEILDCAREKLVAYKNDYNAICTTLKTHIPISANINHKTVTETTLHALAVVKHNEKRIDIYRSQLSSGLRVLQSSYDALAKRLPKQKDINLLDNMRTTADQMKELIDTLTLLVSILTHHQAYFVMYETEAQIGAKYRDEFKVLTDYYGNQNTQADAIRHYIITQSNTSSTPFPRVEYRKKIDYDIEHLEKNINNVIYSYPERTSAVQQYLACLKTIKSYIITDALYAQEMINYEHNQREKERIRIEQEKATAENRKAAAAEREARAREEANLLKMRETYAKEREARAQEEANRIERHRSQVTPVVVVHTNH